MTSSDAVVWHETPNMEAPLSAVVKHEPTAEVVRPADPMVSMIERVVMDPNADLAKLEKMLEMRERLEAQQAKRAFDAAIAAAKGAIPPIYKDGHVNFPGKDGKPATDFRHETLGGIAKIVDPILGAHGLSYRYKSRQDLQNGGRLEVTCVLSHRDGYSEETTLSGSPDTSGSKNNYQAVGSAATYLQRYTLKLALGLAASNDDDGNAAGSAQDAGTITGEQFIALRGLMEQAGGDEAKFLKFFGIEHLHELPLSRLGEADARLRQKIAQKARA